MLQLVAKELFEGVTRIAFTGSIFPGRDVLSTNHLEILAIIGQMFFGYRVSPLISALLRHPRIIADTIQTYLQIRATLMASF
jgi:hypothetical protein